MEGRAELRWGWLLKWDGIPGRSHSHRLWSVCCVIVAGGSCLESGSAADIHVSVTSFTDFR